MIKVTIEVKTTLKSGKLYKAICLEKIAKTILIDIGGHFDPKTLLRFYIIFRQKMQHKIFLHT